MRHCDKALWGFFSLNLDAGFANHSNVGFFLVELLVLKSDNNKIKCDSRIITSPHRSCQT